MNASLRARLVMWLLLPLSISIALFGLLSWRDAAAVADYVQDHDLLSSAKVLAGRLIWEDDDVRASVPPSALSLFASPDHDRVFVGVTDAAGRLLAGSPGFPLPPELRPAGPDHAQWYDTRYDGLPLRAVLTQRTMYDVGGGQEITITIGKTTRSRDRMLYGLWWPTLAYLCVALLLALVLVTVALTWELRPLVDLGRQLAQRDPMRLDFAVDARALHTELRPVADTLNTFVRQLRAHSEAQRRFIADAAHQLRTPLALQATQIDYAIYTRATSHDPDTRRAEMDRVWLAMQTSNKRLVDVTNQLLLLAQAGHGDASAALQPVDLRFTALRIVEQLAALADRKRIDLGFDQPPTGDKVEVRAEPALLDALVANLLDNALRYTPEGGRVTVGVRAAGAQFELSVEDDGPGIPPEARDRVFERFYRVSQETEGTGLGLSIVQEIARAFGASVELVSPVASSRGLRAVVRLQAA